MTMLLRILFGWPVLLPLVIVYRGDTTVLRDVKAVKNDFGNFTWRGN